MADSIQKINLIDIDLSRGTIHRSWCGYAIGMKDSNGDAFGIRVFRNREPVDLDGISVQGFFRNPVGTNIAITSGNNVSGNTAYVVLPQACYDYDGPFTLAIKLIGGGITGTMRIIDGMVDNTNTTGAVAPTGTVPTYQEVLAVFEQMQDALEDYDETVATQNAQISDLKSAISKSSASLPYLQLITKGSANKTVNGLGADVYPNGINLNGTTTGQVQIKYSNESDIKQSGSSSWRDERLGLIVGDEYALVAYVDGGSATLLYDFNIAVRDKDSTTIVYVNVGGSSGLTSKRIIVSPFWTATGNEAFVFSTIASGNTFANLKLQLYLLNRKNFKLFKNATEILIHSDEKEPYGFYGILGNPGTYTFRNVAFTKNADVSKRGNLILDGHITEGNGAKIKVTNTLAGVPVTIPDTWLTDRLGTIAGHKYRLYVNCLSGTYNNYADKDGNEYDEDDDPVGLQFTLRNASNTTVSWCRGLWEPGMCLLGSEFTAAGNESFIVATIPVNTIIDALEFKIGLIDITLRDIYLSKALERDGVERKVDVLLEQISGLYYDEVTVTVGTYTNSEGDTTTYYLATVPKFDSNGDYIPIVAEEDLTYSPMNHAMKEGTTLTANSGMTSNNGQGAVIKNGQVIHESTYPSTSHIGFLVYVGFDDERNVYEFPLSTTGAEMVAEGITNACIAYYRLVEDGEVRDVSQIGLPATNLNYNPRMSMFTKDDGSVCFLACDGRYITEAGLKPEELGALMVSLGAVNGWNLDGGGSTSLTIRGIKQNRHIDGNGTQDRNIHVTWNVPGKVPDYKKIECTETSPGEYVLRCSIDANGKKTYSWVSAE